MLKLITEFIQTFVVTNRQDRLLQFLNKEKNWRKIENEFHTSTIFKNNVLIQIEPNGQNSDNIYKVLKKMGAEDECYSLVDFLKNEKYEWDLGDKLSDSVGFLGETVVYCPKSKLGYFEGGHAKDRYILKVN